jgi:hypothetical protein
MMRGSGPIRARIERRRQSRQPLRVEHPEIFRSTVADAAMTGKRTGLKAEQLKDGSVTVIHNEWIELGPAIKARGRQGRAIFSVEPDVIKQ